MPEHPELEGEEPAPSRHPDPISASAWMVGVFCDDCRQPWAEKAPCPHCGAFSRPEARIFRQVIEGRRWLPWTWHKAFEFGDPAPLEDARESPPPLRAAAAG